MCSNKDPVQPKINEIGKKRDTRKGTEEGDRTVVPAGGGEPSEEREGGWWDSQGAWVGPVSHAARSSLSIVSLFPEPATKLAVRIRLGR